MTSIERAQQDVRGPTSVTVFCGFRTGQRAVDMRVAREFGTLLGERGIALVYGGGGFGMMGAVADATLAAGGQVIGIIPRDLYDKGEAHADFERGRSGMILEIVPDLAVRKTRMMELADGFVALSGGFGTLDELFEVLTWAQLGHHDKPCALVNVEGYYQPLLAMLDQMVRLGFVDPATRKLLHEADTPSGALRALRQHSARLAALVGD